jgi:SAM-dependent methyltransferase
MATIQTVSARGDVQSAPLDGARPARPALKWRALSALLRTLGRTSDGIDLGYRRGFDSGPMLDYVYANRAHGRLLFGQLVDRIYLDTIGWRAIRARKTLLEETLRAEVAHRQQRPTGRTTILDVAAGPGRYLIETVQALGEDGLTVICRDLDPAGLEQGRRLARAAGLGAIRYEQGNACDPASLATVEPHPDIAIASGLYELLHPDPIRRSMAGLQAILPSGGLLIFTTQVAHPQLELIANVLPNRFGRPWVMENRPLATVEAWAREAGFGQLSSRTEPHGIFAVTVARKG